MLHWGYWLVGTVGIYLLLIFLYLKLYERTMNKGLKGNIIKCKLPDIRMFISITTVISAILIIFILINGLSYKNKVYEYKIEDINSLNYEELIKVIKDEFKPEDGKIYITNCCSGFQSEYYDEYNTTVLRIDDLKIIRENKVYTLHLYNNQEAIIIQESDGNMVKVVNGKTDVERVKEFNSIDDIMIAYNNLDLNHIKANINIRDDQYVNVRYSDMPTNPYYVSKSNNKLKNYIIYKDGSINEVIEDINIDSNLYVQFNVYKLVKEAEYDDGTITYISTEHVSYYVEK